MKKSIELKALKVGALEHAPWNPRSEEELAWDNPDMVELIGSVRAMGITQTLAVWDRGSDGMLVIAGNRRLEAAKAANLDQVPAIVYSGISEAEAHEITRTENEIRRGVDPLRDAVLIGSMMDKGLNQKTIAAHFAMSEAMVCRRVKLLGLIDEVRQVVNSTHNIATDALEQIALYPEETQRECLSAIKRASTREGLVTWSALKYDFDRQTRDLDGAKFDTKCCLKCPSRTGAQPDLWDNMPEKGKLGSCIKCDCYERHLREYLAGLVREKIGAKVEMVDACAEDFDYYDLSERDEFSERKSKKCAVAWWFWNSYAQELKVLWGPTLDAYREILKAEEEAEAAEAEAMAKEDAEKKAKREAEEAERLKLNKEIGKLRDEEDDAYGVVSGRIEGMDEKKVVEALKKNVCKAFKKDLAGIIAQALYNWMSYDSEPSDVVSLLEGVPALSKALKVTPKELKAFRDAEKVYSKFKKDHNL